MSNRSALAIWITGAGSGIGAALAQHYAGPGVTLGLLSRSTDGLGEVVARCREKGAEVHAYLGDVGQSLTCRQHSEDFLTKTGRIDVVIANAGIRGEEDQDSQLLEIPEELMRVNYLGVIHTFSPFIKFMKSKGSGQLVAISSIAALRATPNSGAYSASKAAVNLWTESLRLRLLPYGIHTTTLCLGFVQTAMTDGLSFWLPGILTAERAAILIADRIRRKTRTATIPWQSRTIWAVFQILPGTIYDQLILWAKAHGPKR